MQEAGPKSASAIDLAIRLANDPNSQKYQDAAARAAGRARGVIDDAGIGAGIIDYFGNSAQAASDAGRGLGTYDENSGMYKSGDWDYQIPKENRDDFIAR
jgi:hypothetical protein